MGNLQLPLTLEASSLDEGFAGTGFINFKGRSWSDGTPQNIVSGASDERFGGLSPVARVSISSLVLSVSRLSPVVRFLVAEANVRF